MAWADVVPGCRVLLNRAVGETVVLVVRGLARECWKCATVAIVPVVLHPRGAAEEFSVMEALEGDLLVMLREYLVEVGHPVAATIKPRFSKTVGELYLSHGCPACDALFGAFPLGEDVTQMRSPVQDWPVVAEVERPLLEWWAWNCNRDNLWDYAT